MRVTIEIDPERLPPHTPEQLREWLNYKLGAACEMAVINPLADCDLESCVKWVAGVKP